MFDDDDEDQITSDNAIAICPPDEPPNADTDKDSNMSGEEAMGNVDHLPARYYVPKWYTQDKESDADIILQRNDETHAFMRYW
ncbi:hypothetical protein QE152_g25555 [Popillia japonica]|uniref:Uncharacterized protein n=1 Tax=Popillia japonica TaxID=7064 RepID=A0AAW1K1N0_POPJA